MKLIWASPTYGGVHPDVVTSQRMAMMHAVKYAGVEWYGDVSTNDVKQSTIDTVRNKIVDEAIRSSADAIFWCDSDIELPPDAISKLVIEQKDFITGIYCQRHAPHFPVVTHFDPKGGKHNEGTFNWFVNWPENVVAPVDACGFGCVLTSVAMLKAMPKPCFTFGDYSEDFTFCRKAAEAGWQLYVQTAVLCKHIGEPVKISVDDFRREWAARGGNVYAGDDLRSAVA